jgi:hypothetical protein
MCEDMMDIDWTELDTFAPTRIVVVPLSRLKTKTTKTS